MNKQLLPGWIIAILALMAYLSIGLLLTRVVSLVVGVLFFVFFIWFLGYKLRYKNLGKLELVMKMSADFKETLERTKVRLAKDQAPRRRVTASRRRQALLNRESRKADSSKEVPVDKKHMDLIERRVREARARQDQSRGINDTES